MSKLSDYAKRRKPSAIRVAGIDFRKRPDAKEITPINVAIGNIDLDVYEAISKKEYEIVNAGKHKRNRYTPSIGTSEINKTWLHIIKSSGFDTEGLFVNTTVGGSYAMDLLLRATSGNIDGQDTPIMLIDPAYANYMAFAESNNINIVSITRSLQEDGKFNLPEMEGIEKVIQETKPSALVIIPYDNPTGQLFDYEAMKELAALCVKYNMWMVSDEAYRELYYDAETPLVSIWGLSDADVPGIEGRRISIETASKVWNACGLRIGGLITDSAEFNNRSVAEYTANLCANVIGQYIFGALANETKEELIDWVSGLRNYYQKQIMTVYNGLKEMEPNLIVSSPDASIYSVIDVRNIVKPGFDATEFVLYCAEEGSIEIDGVDTTLLVAPMKGFYNTKSDEKNPGSTQFRISFVESPENMAKIPELFIKLLKQYESQR
ncbi:MAG: aminotransferase class I/II-fold pyridoxal phosphate-dependent enzyme [Clostridiales bacterium]|nr:aminotransferase class I/II-fold pyridoxal phosphate-dependent enzyme [Clostridiales bacterium]